MHICHIIGQHEVADALYRQVLNKRKATLRTDSADAIRTVSSIYMYIL